MNSPSTQGETLAHAPVRRTFALVALVVLTLGFAGFVGTVTARAATITLPDMKILVPTNLISIGVDPTSGHKLLRYTHITEDAGTGPFEIDPSYNSATGVSSFVQALYSSASPGVWTLDHTVPLAINGVFDSPSDYRFPLTRFTLNNVNGDGTIGAIVSTSPKAEYCITGDNRVADVPNTPAHTYPPVSNCTDPTKPLGWSVGWGDQYDQTDSGQPIDLNGLADGTYILRAIVDPQHVLTESDATNNVTDTVLTITGNAVTAGAQTRPTVVPPDVALLSPTQGATVGDTVNLTATASATAPATISSLQYLLDGNPLGGPQTVAPYGYTWTVGSTPPGNHRLSAQVTDSTGTIGTSPVVTVTVPASTPPGGLAIDQNVTKTGRGTITTAAFSTTAAGETLVAFVGSDGPATTGVQSVTVTGGGLAWRRVRQVNSQYGDAEVWTASAPNVLSAVTVRSTPARANYDQQLNVLSFVGSAGVGASAGASAGTGAATVNLTAAGAGSLSYAVGEDWDRAAGRTAGSGQAIVSQWLDATTGDTFWVQARTAPSSSAGELVTLNDTAPTTDRWNLAAVEVIPSGAAPPPPPDTTPPSATVTNPANGQTVSGATPVAATASDNVAVASVQFLLDGQPLGNPVTAPPYAITWDTTLTTNAVHTVSARATDTSGNVGTSATVTVTVQNPAPPMTCFILQAQRSVHGHGTVTTPSFSTAMAGEVLVAFVGSDGPQTSGSQSVAVSGAGLTWTLVKRANAQYGDAEVWTATAPAVLTNVTVRSTPVRSGYDQDLTVIAMEGTVGVGASVAGSAASGAPGLNVTTTEAASLVLAVGHDWDKATARTLPTGLVMLDQWPDTSTGDTFWSEYTNQTTGAAGTVVHIGATAPTGDRWNMVAIELEGDDD